MAFTEPMGSFKNLNMNVIKRNGSSETISFDKIQNRLENLGKQANLQINYTWLTMKVIEQLHNNIHTTKIDELSAQQCTSLYTIHPDYGTLAAHIVISNHHKNTSSSLYEVVDKLYNFVDERGENYPLVSPTFYKFVIYFRDELNEMINYDRDYLIDYFGFKTLERAYLYKIKDAVIERPQHMWMRVAIGIHGTECELENLSLVKETYDLMSQKYFTHATPTLFNAGSPYPQLSSCFLLQMEEDSIEGIYNTVKSCALISKYAGGIGLGIHNIRATNSHIRGTNGQAGGIVPMLRVFNSSARYVNQSGKRNGSFAIYLEPWHPDIFEFLEMRKNHGDEEMKARDLFYALWISDLFMQRVKEENGKWSLFCPDECPGLADVYGAEFEKLYIHYETLGKARKVVSARKLWLAILDSQMETGTPYLLYKDASNMKSNQKNLGTIKNSNLCTEIIEYSDKDESAVCNLASISLPAFVNPDTKQFDYEKLHEVTKVITQNLNKVIDINFYPTKQTEVSNLLHRPIGIGVQGLADAFILMDLVFYSPEAQEVNKLIFETIYHAALEKSNEIALDIKTVLNKPLDETVTNLRTNYIANLIKVSNIVKEFEDRGIFKYSTASLSDANKYIGAYRSFVGSPLSKGIFQFDMWGEKPYSNRYDWNKLRASIKEYGVRNSLLVAPMPTASTSQILGNNECFEPFTSNLYTRRTLAGEFIVPNKYLMKELIDLGIWDEQIKNNIISNKGSIQQLSMIPEHIRNKYKIVWEIPMKHIIDMAADRGIYICQSQSLNLWMEDPTYSKLTSMHFYAWQKGLKTGIYYLRRKAKHQAQQFTIEPEIKDSEEKITLEDEEGTLCAMCSA
jgi:ribonucleoside-diphosphate reductase alpha chain